MLKCYNVSIAGKVQDIGFRSVIEDTARFLGLKGYVFNDIDGSVKMVCCGDNNAITSFLKEIAHRGEQKGVVIDEVAKEEIPFQIFLPEKFSKLYTDELVDIGRKLDRGNEYLGEIKGDTSELVIEMRGHNKEQAFFNQEMREHNKHLEKILGKIAER